MKKVLLSAAILASVPISSAFAENVAISVNPVGFFFGVGNVRAEYLGISNNVGIFGGGLFTFGRKFGDVNVSAFGAEAGGRYYFMGDHSGPYLQGGVGFIRISGKDSRGATGSSTLIFPSALIGFRLGSKFFIDAGVGGSYYMGNFSVGNVKIAAFNGFALALDLSLGLKF